jgi:hypothetical protein
MAAIFNGCTTWSSANYYQASSGIALGDPSGFWFAWLFIPPSSASSTARIFGAAKHAAGGWDTRTSGAMSLVSWQMFDASGTPAAVTSATSSIATTDQDKLQLYVGVWDGPGLKQRCYWKRAETGSGTARNGYTASTAPLTIGYDAQNSSTPGDVVRTLGFAYGVGVPVLAEVQALYDAVQTQESMQSIPGKTTILLDLTLDTIANGGAVPSTLTNRSSGGGTYTKNGSPTLTSMYARAWGW